MDGRPTLADRQKHIPGDMELYVPFLNLGPKIPHYYGDAVRKIFLAVSAILLIFAPFFGGYTPWSLPFEILGAVILVCLAALTNPQNHAVMFANALAAGLGLVMFETVALYAYLEGDFLMFAMREALAILFLFALYFSIKTARAMTSGTIGRHTTTGEFLEEEYTKEDKLAHIRRMTDSDD